MSDYFIDLAEKLVGVLMTLLIIGVVVSALMASGQSGGLLSAIIILVLGGVNVIMIGGLLYLGFGIYHNTRRTAEALEAQNRTGGGL